MLLKYGFIQNNTYQELEIFTAYPVEYFCPKSFKTGKTILTENTHSIHHYDATWTSVIAKKYQKIVNKTTGAIGDNQFSRIIVLFIYFAMSIEEKGLFPTIKLYLNKLIKHR
jgi:hypothetical protein